MKEGSADVSNTLWP